jgi:hypothetical protein
MKEAAARIKINKLLEAAGWRFFADGKLPANIQLTRFEQKIQTTLARIWGEDKILSAGSPGEP